MHGWWGLDDDDKALLAVSFTEEEQAPSLVKDYTKGIRQRLIEQDTQSSLLASTYMCMGVHTCAQIKNFK